MSNNDLNNKIFDDLISYACEKRMNEAIPNELPTDDEIDKEISMSPEFTKRMELYFKKSKQKYHSVRIRKIILKVVAAVVVLLIVSTTIVFSVDALRVPVLNFFNDINKTSATIHVNDAKVNYDAFSNQIKGLYLPNCIPEDYTVKSINGLTEFYTVTFENPDGSMIRLVKLSEGDAVGVDSENANAKQITVNNEPAEFYNKDGTDTLVFKYDKKAFTLTGIISIDESVRIAESLEYRS
jgi:hypothetical protein